MQETLVLRHAGIIMFISVLCVQANGETILVDTSPSGARVYTDDNNRPSGKTPSAVNLDPGRHQLKFTMQGYYDKVTTLKVRPRTNPPFRVDLLKKRTFIAVKTKPYRTTVFIDGEEIGENENTFSSVPREA